MKGPRGSDRERSSSEGSAGGDGRSRVSLFAFVLYSNFIGVKWCIWSQPVGRDSDTQGGVSLLVLYSNFIGVKWEKEEEEPESGYGYPYIP